MDGGSMEISLDKLQVKRLDAIEENGVERFPTDVGYDEKRLSLIRRIDFAWAVEREEEEDGEKDNYSTEKRRKKKQKSSKESSVPGGTPWQWQGMVENLQLAHQELSVIIDLINTVEANDAITVAGMTRPKQLPTEMLADLSVSTATKLQCYRHLGKYFKQSAKALEQQVVREAKFYGALIRLQQNWKVKRQRVASIAPGNEGFTIDLSDSSAYDTAAISRPSSLATIHIDHDSAGMLAIKLPPNSCRSLRFGFIGPQANDNHKKPSELKSSCSVESPQQETDEESASDDPSVERMHSLLREVHQAIFAEQVFDMINRGAFSQSFGVNVTGICENYLRLSIGPEASVFISLVPSNQDQSVATGGFQSFESAVLPLDTLEGVKLPDEKDISITSNRTGVPSSVCYEIYLQQLFHEHIFARPKDRSLSSGTRISGQPSKDGAGLLGHFCMSLAHGMFASKVLGQLENVVYRVPFLHLISHPTWHSRTSSWTISMKVPRSILHGSSLPWTSDIQSTKNVLKSEFRTKVVVGDDCITVEAEGSPNILGLFKGSSEDLGSMNKYNCDLANLPVIVLEQVASQVISWLHEEALMVGIKVNRDFLCLSFELEQGEILSLAAQVDPEDPQGCISWWLVMEDGFAEERKLHLDIAEGGSEYRKFLGCLSLDVLYSTLIDLVSLCSGGGSK